MTKDEFMFDHDLDLIIDLINREIELRNSDEPANDNNNEVMRATDFL
ncbi:hypothetical protein [Ruoffia tabacinasalis]|nr:hypothetical protein [Ruoffia tabacinasalis]